MSHRCPGPDCTAQVPDRMLACMPHWMQVPRPIQRAVYAAWNRGKGIGSDEHVVAVEDAISHMRPTGRT